MFEGSRFSESAILLEETADGGSIVTLKDTRGTSLLAGPEAKCLREVLSPSLLYF